jgi:hypothetical protein
MAFGGTAVVQQVSDQIVRITGLTLSGSGTIGLFGATGTTPGVRLPESFKPEPYGYQGAQVELQDSISVEVVTAAAATTDFTIPISVVKTGTTPATFRATLNSANASESPGLEIYVRFHI